MIGEIGETAYVDPLQVEEEVRRARRLFAEAAMAGNRREPALDRGDRCRDPPTPRPPGAFRLRGWRGSGSVYAAVRRVAGERSRQSRADPWQRPGQDPTAHGESGDRAVWYSPRRRPSRAAMLQAAGVSFSGSAGAGGRRARSRTPCRLRILRVGRPRGHAGQPSRPAASAPTHRPPSSSVPTSSSSADRRVVRQARERGRCAGGS